MDEYGYVSQFGCSERYEHPFTHVEICCLVEYIWADSRGFCDYAAVIFCGERASATGLDTGWYLLGLLENRESLEILFFDPQLLEKGKISIAKSLTSKQVKEGSVLYATKVHEDQLDPSTPWMIQDYVDASKDITVAFVRDQVFGFELNRESFLERTVDWREVDPSAATDMWTRHPIPKSLEDSIFGFMSDLRLHFGRLDMLYVKGDYFFLEVNPNGEWAWLDFDGKIGLLGKIIEEISPTTPRHSIPISGNICL